MPARKPPRTRLNLVIPLDLRTRLDLILWSPAEERIPHGAYADLITSLLRQHLTDEKPLNLAPYGLPDGYYVRGRPEVLEALRQRLEIRNVLT